VQAGTLAATLADDLAHLAASNAAEAIAGIDAKHVISTVQARSFKSADDGIRVSLGQIKALIAPLSIDAAGLEQLGFPHVATDKAKRLYRACDLPAIREAMVQHLAGLRLELPLAV